MSVNIVGVCRTALLGDLFTSRSKTGDVTLVCEDGAVSAHRQILSCLSHQFSCLLQPKTHNCEQRETSVIQLSGVSTKEVDVVLTFGYMGWESARWIQLGRTHSSAC